MKPDIVLNCDFLPLYDVNYTVVEDKFVNSILHVHYFSVTGDNEICNTWSRESDFDFGFVPGENLL